MKNHITISVDAEKTFHLIQHKLIIKKPNTMGIEEIRVIA